MTHRGRERPGDLDQLRRWVRRSSVAAGALGRALGAATVAGLTSLGLLIGAAGLLVVSAGRPGLRAVAVLLVVIEVFAFFRSPIRYVERMTTHRLGFIAVTRWRRWLMGTVGHWSYRTWSHYARGDVLGRSLQDTEELQDLWVRGVVPAASALATLLIADVAVGALAPRPGWLAVAAGLLITHGAAIVLMRRRVAPLVARDRERRQRRATYQALLVELSGTAPEIALLGRDDYVAERLDVARRALGEAERAFERERRRVSLAIPAASLVAALWLGAARPVSAPVWLVSAALVIVAAIEVLTTTSGALDTAIAVTAATERLDELAQTPPPATAPWPVAVSLELRGLVLRDGTRTLVEGLNVRVAPRGRVAVTGTSGTGKSWLLRAIAGLDDTQGGSILIGDQELTSIGEEELRRHVAYVPSEPGLMRGRAADVVALGRTLTRPYLEDLAAVGIVADADRRWEGLSRGEEARVAVVRALAISPDVVLLDEPTAGLGASDTAALLALLERAGAIIVVATHDPLVIAWADAVVELDAGRVPRG